MRRVSAFLVVFGILVMAAVALRATAQDGPLGGGPGGAQRREGPGGPGGPGGGFRLIPRFAVEKLNLTEDQQKQIAELEKETKAKLYKILTAAQQKTLEEARPPQGGPGGAGGPGGGQRKPSDAPGGAAGGKPSGKPGGKPGGKPSGGPDGVGSGSEKPSRPQRPASE
jgi:Spy/CpxP family protein refolding chaperone